jgi:hypothetical protein
MLAALLRLFALRPLLAITIFGIPLLVLALIGLFTVVIVKLLVFVVLPIALVIWAVRWFLDSDGGPTSDSDSPV